MESDGKNFRQRLLNFYTVYNPTCVGSVDSILKTYSGREGDLIKVLVAKYGPEPSAAEVASHQQRLPSETLSQASRATTPSEPDNRPHLRERVIRFYQHYNPEKLKDVDKVLAAFRNQSDETLMSNLVKKYGPEPYEVLDPKAPAASRPSEQPVKQQVAAAPPESQGKSSPTLPPAPPAAHSDSKAAESVDAENSGAREAVARPAVEERKQPLQPWNVRFYNFYEYYRPEKLSQLERKLKEHEGREEEWMQLLVHKYGPEPPPRSLSRSTPPPATSETDFASRLRDIYKDNDPHFLSRVSTMSSDQQREEQEALLQFLLKRYQKEQSAGGEERHDIHNGNDRGMSYLRSPSPPSADELRQSADQLLEMGRLASKLQDPREAEILAALSTERQLRAELENVVTQLSESLDAKTAEVAKVSRERIVALAELEANQDEINRLHAALESAKATSLEHSQTRHEVEKRRTEHSVDVATMEEELRGIKLKQVVAEEEVTKLTTEIDRLQSTVAVREHQQRTLRMQLERTVEEVQRRDVKIVQLMRQAEDDARTILMLKEEITALRLELTPPTDHTRFYEVIKEIESEFKIHYDEQLERVENDFKERTDSLVSDLKNREEIIEQLTEQMLRFQCNKILGKPDADDRSVSATSSKDEMEAEIERLRMQLRVQQEEQKALATTMSLRRTVRPEVLPSTADVNRKSESESFRPQVALEEELRRQMDEMTTLHARLARYEEEQRLSDLQIKELGHEVAHWKSQVKKT